MRRLFLALACMAFLSSENSMAQQTRPPPPWTPGIIGAPAGTGPYPAIAEVVPELRTHTLYHPVSLPARKMPLVLWAEGGCRDNGLAYAAFLREIASHGYLVVAVGHARREEPMRPALPRSTVPVKPTGTPGGAGPGPGADETQSSQLIDGLNWANAENRRAGSTYYRHLDTSRVAVMGHSCGGLQAIQIAADPRITTAMIWDSGVYNRGPATGRSGVAVTKEQLRSIHIPIAYINGGPADIAYANALDDFERINQVPAFFGWIPVGHGGTFFTAPHGGEFAQVAVSWLDWQLKGNRRAGAMFSGPDCGLCRDKEWTVRRKRLD
jgi:dienelactone hydrolase